jgi:hypothetical protein
MKQWQRIILLLNCGIAFLLLATPAEPGQMSQAGPGNAGVEPVKLRIRLRDSSGRPVTGEPVVLERLPEEGIV